MTRIAFITSTMASRSNGPANFAINLYNKLTKAKRNLSYHFFSEEIHDSLHSTRISSSLPLILRPVGMILKGITYSLVVKKESFDLIIWNFSVLAWYHILTNNSKNIVFVNDVLSLDPNNKIFTYKNIRYRIFRIFEKYACRNCSLVVTNSKIIKDKIIKEYSIDEKKILTLYKGINFQEITNFKEKHSLIGKKKIRIGFAKSDYKTGGLDLLCESLSKLENLEFEVVLISAKIRPNTKNTKYKNITISLHQKLSKQELYKTLASVDIYCVPAINEAFGQSNIEAMYIKLPTIILPTKMQKAIHSEEYCWIPEGLTPLDLAKTVQSIINTPVSEIERKVLLAHKTVMTRYNFESTIHRLENSIQKIIKNDKI